MSMAAHKIDDETLTKDFHQSQPTNFDPSELYRIARMSKKVFDRALRNTSSRSTLDVAVLAAKFLEQEAHARSIEGIKERERANLEQLRIDSIRRPRRPRKSRRGNVFKDRPFGKIIDVQLASVKVIHGEKPEDMRLIPVWKALHATKGWRTYHAGFMPPGWR